MSECFDAVPKNPIIPLNRVRLLIQAVDHSARSLSVQSRGPAQALACPMNQVAPTYVLGNCSQTKHRGEETQDSPTVGSRLLQGETNILNPIVSSKVAPPPPMDHFILLSTRCCLSLLKYHSFQL